MSDAFAETPEAFVEMSAALVAMSAALDAPLVSANVSRLVYDCNRPPESDSAMPARSERFDVPGNADLTLQDRAARVAEVYLPFGALVADTIARHQLQEVERRLASLASLRQELCRMIDQCAGGTVADCRVIESLADHAHCIADRHTTPAPTEQHVEPTRRDPA